MRFGLMTMKGLDTRADADLLGADQVLFVEVVGRNDFPAPFLGQELCASGQLLDVANTSAAQRGGVPDEERGDRRSRSLHRMGRVTCEVEDEALVDLGVIELERVAEFVDPVVQGHRYTFLLIG